MASFAHHTEQLHLNSMNRAIHTIDRGWGGGVGTQTKNCYIVLRNCFSFII